MPKVRIKLLTIAVTGALLLALGSCAESSTPTDEEGGGSTEGPIAVGAVLDITGAGASLGVPERKTVEMLAKQINDSGGINGRQINLIIEDNQSTEDAAARAASKLLQTDKVSLLLGASRTGPSLAMRPIAEQAKIPMISFAANEKIVHDSTWVFKTAQNDNVVIEKIIDDMQKKGYKTIAIARDASGFGEGVAETFTELGKDAGIKVVAVEKFAPDASDFTAQMVNIRNADADANVIWGIPPAASLAQVAYRRLDIKAPVYQSHGIGNQVFLDSAGKSADGLLAPLGRLLVVDQLPADDPQRDVISGFVSDYKKAYNESPSTFAGHSFDGFTIGMNALKEAGTDPTKLREAIEGVKDWPGVSGVFTMTPENHSGLTKDALVMVTVQDGKWKLVPGQGE
ncbi:MAG: ABC transporter substrate-binding protein [Microlunatus sp.]|nr:ABC transporter substrate-binding protein [Microlunatus sp.]MDN5792081.1 ABC transporter substrate-binding protein [Brevibacterium aurantiacum]